MKTRDSPNYEELRVILERQLNRSVSLEEAKQYGDWLINFYKHLASQQNESTDRRILKVSGNI